MEQKITVVIPTYNRSKLLKKTVNTLLKESNNVSKIIVLNTAKKPLNSFKNVKKVQIQNVYPLNLLQAKNSAFKNIKNTWSLILDDDLLFNSNLPKKFVNNINKFKFDAACGLVKSKREYKFWEIENYNYYGKMLFCGVANLNFNNLKSTKPYLVDFAPGGFLFVKTKVIKNLSFDTNYILPFFNEDTDITHRMVKKGYKIMFFSDIECFHLQYKKGGNRKKVSKKYWFYAFGFNNSYFIVKNFGLFKYFLYSIFRCFDHFYVLRQFSIKIYLSYIKGIYGGYKKAKAKHSCSKLQTR